METATNLIHIYRDGAYITTVADETALLRWFHREHSYSLNHAVRYEGYSLRDDAGQVVSV